MHVRIDLMKLPPWKVWQTRILKQNSADESGMYHKPRYYGGGTTSSALGRAGSGQKASGNPHREQTTSNWPSNTWHCGIEDGKKHNPTQAAGFDYMDRTPLSLQGWETRASGDD